MVLLLTAFAAAAPAAPAAGAAVHTIGTLGASFESAEWERTKITENGRDQFRGIAGNDSYLLAFELFGLFDRRDDFTRRFERFFVGIRGRQGEIEVEPELGFERYDGFTRAVQRFRTAESSVELAYQLDLISAGDGVGYLLVSWTPRSNAEQAQEAMERLVDSFRLPAEGSEWQAKARLRPHALAFGDWTVELTFADSVFAASTDDQPGRRYTLHADEEAIAVHVFVDEVAGSADDALDFLVETVSQDEPYDELERTDLDLAAGRGREVLLRSRGEGSHDVAIAVVELEPGRWVDLRMVTDGPSGHREELWNRLVASLRVASDLKVDAYPVVEVLGGEDAPTLSAPARRLLEASRFLANVPWTRQVDVGPDGALLVKEDERVVRYESGARVFAKDDAPPAVLYAADSRFEGNLVAWGDETLLVGMDEVQRIAGEGLEPLGFRAEVAAVAGDELLVARGPEERTMLGLGALPRVGPVKVLLRSRGGQEREVLEVADRAVTGLAFRDGRVLVVAAPFGLRVDRSEATVELRLVDTGSRAVSSLGRWRTVERIAPATVPQTAADAEPAAGWLVSGTGADGDAGVFFVGDDGGRELLLSGGHLGVAVDGTSLVFVAADCLEIVDVAQGCAYRARLAAVREHGRGVAPFGAWRLHAIAVAARASLGGASEALPATREELAAFHAAADAAAREQTGASLPVDRHDVDPLLADLAYDSELSEDAIALLAVVLAESLVRGGAEWVPPAAGEPRRLSGGGLEAQNALALGIQPLAVVRSVLWDEDGWYRPATEIGEQAAGRALLVGFGPAGLRQGVAAADLPQLPGLLARGDVEPLRRLLEERRGNVYLREQVYSKLAAHGHDEALARLAAGFAAAEDAAPIDHLTAAAARLSRPLRPADAEGLVAALRGAIERHPDTAALYLLLGSAYEGTTRPERVPLARASYRKAQTMMGWGDVGQAAEAALERLGVNE